VIDVPQDFFILANRLLLIQIFSNLIKNALWAIKVANKGALIISAKKEDKLVSIEFLDTAIGIEEEESKKLFKPFYSKNKNGVGIGLAFCKLALRNMGGSIYCESKEGCFTRFIIRLLEAEETKKETLNEISSSIPVSYHGGTSR
jgi:signal transduction histidine kinase